MLPKQDFNPEWDLPRPPMGFVGAAVWISFLVVLIFFLAKAIFF